MHLSAQQMETLTFFDRVPLEWRMRAAGQAAKVNVIAQRNGCVHRVHAAHPGIATMLDVGCGTGELVFEMAAKNVDATGIDFAPAMIQVCEQRRAEAAVQRAHFRCCSVWEFGARPESYDLISALGFIEYVTRPELTDFLAFAHSALRPGGLLVVSSRNRLFNLVSLNEYTRLEMALGTTDVLLREATALGEAENLETALAAAPEEELPQHTHQPPSWIGVGVRHQYTPAGLAGIVRRAGFEVAAAYPVHYHPLPPAAAGNGLHSTYIGFSNLMFETAPDDHRLIPFCSSFVLAARKL